MFCLSAGIGIGDSVRNSDLCSLRDNEKPEQELHALDSDRACNSCPGGGRK
ncbi:hypothetical protein SH2C18_34680 [Clostridium sediminicola]|uniref:hypothetical protein n=1 Tax=Clostridium sediminicola TaxID=3114879 RepID=UPI0031F23773